MKKFQNILKGSVRECHRYYSNFWHFGEMRDLTGATRSINDVDVTKVGDASFIPGYIQATDYSDLGKFMVAKLKTTL